ncbi:PP2C family protein-serine/threonine phosphatase [Geodermatophilus ruber]|uniref:Serine phosphatase RsbU, regulator of sigma subunit n=1 Tax=Geodermatophilus ruber TaxID=504800 RepID=A0A1I4HSW4_9ACTN|nr:GAF domain-containing SpoIIE family protein phosphatase [Geodermatophilus ruber]SFL45235.1 Serine phosphatase RsbU, regulator of sigma subunit [Geodermatophilus ruber]
MEKARTASGPAAGAAPGASADRVAVFDADWTIVAVDEGTAALLGRRRDELVDRNIWIALPELAGTIFHSFLLHARSVGERVTWRGFYAPRNCWLEATAVPVGGRLHVQLAAATGSAPAEGAAGHATAPGEGAESDRLRFLAEVSEAMISTLDADESVGKLVDLVVPRLCDWAVVSVLGDDGQSTEQVGAHRDPSRLADLDIYLTQRVQSPRDDSNPMAAALLTGEPIHLASIDQELVEPTLGTDAVREAWRRLDAASLTIVPLRARAETFGALGLVNTSARPPHSEMQIATAVEVARRASLAIDNARLYGRQLKVAETLQRSLLTPPPQPDHLEIAVRYQPAASHMHVGGDWYDAFQQPDGATLLVIGDVVGHNVDAAAAMGQVRSIVRGIAYDRQEQPARILTRVDTTLTGLRIGTLATALIARIEQPPGEAAEDRRTLRWSSAGHLPPLVRRADGRVERLDTPPETLLGTGAHPARSDASVQLLPGDVVVFYTDGLVEQGRTGIDEGLARLTALVGELGPCGVDDLCDGLLERIVRHRSDDDVAIVAVAFHAAGGAPPR